MTTRKTAAEPPTMPAMAPLDRIGELEGGSMVGVAGDTDVVLGWDTDVVLGWDTDVVLGWGGENDLEKAPEM